MFWTDWDREYPRIESSNLDGTDRIILVDALLAMPNSLSVDFQTKQLCWTDGGAPVTQTSSAILPTIGICT